MSGQVLSIITKRDFDFSNLTSLTLEVPLVRAVDVTDAKDITLQVRVHSRTITGGSVQVIARAISLTEEEPNTDFVGGDVATIPLGTAAPTLHLMALTQPFGAMIRVVVKATGAAASTIRVNISVDLIIRDN